MKRTTRREFLTTSMTGTLALGLSSLGVPRNHLMAAGPNEQVRVAVVGLGGVDIPGAVGGRGRQLIVRLQAVPGVRVVALCDVDRAVLDHELQPFKERHETVAVYTDIRKLLDDKRIDAVAIATPNHWHALATIWACQAGKDVYVEKPFSYNLWEGRQMVAAARKFGRMVQVGTQSRSSEVLRQAIEYLRRGEIGPMCYAHAIVYRAREGIGKAGAPRPVPSTVDYDLWCGPAPQTPLLRKQLHYDWHWCWSTGNGEIGNNGAHFIDVGRWALGQNRPPPRAMSIGGRFAFDDDGETPNTQIAIFDYQPAPLICEVRNVKVAKAADAIGKFRNIRQGVVIDCAGGYFAGDSSGGSVFDTQGRKIKEFREDRQPVEWAISTAHMANFVAAVRSRNAGDLRAEAVQGHLSAACSHMANASHRIGQRSAPQAIAETIQSNRELADAFERCREHLQANGVDLAAAPAVAGPWVTWDAERECFVGEFAEQASAVSRRAYRPPFVVPEIA
jgi:predicted dehydrogenase